MAEIWSPGTFFKDVWANKISALYLLYFQSYKTFSEGKNGAKIGLIFYSFHFKAAFHNCLTQISRRWFMQELFPSRQFSPKSETALGPIAHGSVTLAELFCALGES